MNGRRARELRRQAPLLAGKRPVGLLEYLARPTRGYGNDDVSVARQIVDRSGILQRMPERPTSTPGPKPKGVSLEGVLTGLALNAVLHRDAPFLREATLTLACRIPKEWRVIFGTDRPMDTEDQRNAAAKATERVWKKFRQTMDSDPRRVGLRLTDDEMNAYVLGPVTPEEMKTLRAAGVPEEEIQDQVKSRAHTKPPLTEAEVAEKDELLIWACNRLVWATASILFEEMADNQALPELLLGLDATFVEANSRMPTEELNAADCQGGHYVREVKPASGGTTASGTPIGRFRPYERTIPQIGFGYESHTVHLTPDPSSEFRDIPGLTVGISTDVPAISPERNGLTALLAAVANGLPTGGTIGFDTAYDTPGFKQGTMEAGFRVLYDPRATMADNAKELSGAKMVGGQPMCPGLDRALMEINNDFHGKKIDKATMYARAEARKPFEPWVKEYLPDGRITFMCPAQAPHGRKPKCSCALVPQSLAHGLDLVPHPPGKPGNNKLVAPGRLCENGSITVDPMEHTEVWQEYRHRSPEWRRDYFAARNVTERRNSGVKAGFSVGLGSGDRRCLRGKANTSLLSALMHAAQNIEIISSWLRKAERDEEGAIVAPPRKNRRGERLPWHCRGAAAEEPAVDEVDDELAGEWQPVAAPARRPPPEPAGNSS